MISINDLTVSFGGFTLLDNISLHINDRERLGLVGKNGAGKSTLLKLIMGLQVPTSGRIMKPAGVKLGYLPQIMEHAKGRTVMEETMTAFEELKRMNERMDEISRELAERTDYESQSYHRLMVELNEVSDAISLQGSEPPEMQAERTLTGLGFRKGEMDRLTDTFSQGWNMRIELAKILLRKPDVLLLDEPTNHLDIESIQWLEDYLKEFRGALVLISHDRRFLDNCTERTVEIMLGHVYDYKVPYSKYVELRKERIAQQKAAYENQQRMIEKTEEFIERFRYKATKSNQVQSRIKQLNKLDRIEIDEEDLSQIRVKFPPAPRSGDVAFQVKDAIIGYPASDGRFAAPVSVPAGRKNAVWPGNTPAASLPEDKVVLRNANLIVKRGEKVAFVGRNGEGKTTMMRVLMGELTPFSGEAIVGHNVSIGYYAQNQNDVLNKNDTVMETLDRVAVGEIRTKLRDILAAFLFKGEDIDKKVSVLSGGERSRLAMARLMLNPYNLLALDEPTNHMDIRSKDVLKQALKAYDGTLIVVSHDRDFLDGLVEKIYEFGDGKVKEHLGGVDDFLRRKRVESFRELEMKAAPAPAKAPAEPAPAAEEPERKQQNKDTYRQQKALSREEKRNANRRNSLEKRIAELEQKMKEVETLLSAPTPETDIMELTRSYLELKRELDEKMEEWITLEG
ncbi:MAG: ABC-F family ATP-binding cassette domain-containing protein [Bacteroidales bacterium]|nr:ABC-F family ATP-binding cassette domain-containing protein [Bacteroidales bacterium]